MVYRSTNTNGLFGFSDLKFSWLQKTLDHFSSLIWSKDSARGAKFETTLYTLPFQA